LQFPWYFLGICMQWYFDTPLEGGKKTHVNTPHVNHARMLTPTQMSVGGGFKMREANIYIKTLKKTEKTNTTPSASVFYVFWMFFNIIFGFTHVDTPTNICQYPPHLKFLAVWMPVQAFKQKILPSGAFYVVLKNYTNDNNTSLSIIQTKLIKYKIQCFEN